MTRKEREMLQRKNDMLKAAKELIMDKGYYDTTLKEIAKKSEFTRITLYSYFKSKLDIACILFFKELHNFFLQFEKKIKTVNNAVERLRLFGKEYYRFFADQKGFHQFVFYLESIELNETNLSKEALELKEKAKDKAREIWLDIFSNGFKNDELREGMDTDIAITVFWKSIFAIIHSYVFHPEQKIEQLDIEIDYLVKGFQK